MTEIDEMLTPAETARILGVKRQTLSAWRLYGRGPRFVRVGRLIRYRRETIEKWIAGNEVSSTSMEVENTTGTVDAVQGIGRAAK